MALIKAKTCTSKPRSTYKVTLPKTTTAVKTIAEKSQIKRLASLSFFESTGGNIALYFLRRKKSNKNTPTKADVKNESPDNRAYRKYLYHGISHHLGIDVHDLGTKTEPIKAGMVFTVEPGIYIEEEQMGVRIENNIWITKTGNKDLFKNIPIKAEEIESLMKGK